MSRPDTLSTTVSRAVSMMTGMALSRRRRRSTSMPDRAGSMMSSSTRSNSPDRARSSPARPSKAFSTSYPSYWSSSSTMRASFSSTSTNRILSAISLAPYLPFFPLDLSNSRLNSSRTWPTASPTLADTWLTTSPTRFLSRSGPEKRYLQPKNRPTTSKGREIQ